MDMFGEVKYGRILAGQAIDVDIFQALVKAEVAGWAVLARSATASQPCCAES
jgi:hypothetical protein